MLIRECEPNYLHNKGCLHLWCGGLFFFLLVLKPYGRRSEPPRNLKINNRVNFNLYVVPLWINGATGKVLGRLRAPPVQI